MNFRSAYPLESQVEAWKYFKVSIYLTLSLKGEGERGRRVRVMRAKAKKPRKEKCGGRGGNPPAILMEEERGREREGKESERPL